MYGLKGMDSKMVQTIVGETYMGRINGKRIKVRGIKKDTLSGSKTVIYKNCENGEMFEYGYEAFKRCLLDLEGEKNT